MSESAGERLKTAIEATYELDAGEVVLLDQVVELCDALSKVNDAVAGLEDLTATGSAGQSVEHPLLRTQRAYSLALAKLIEAMRLPVPGAAPEDEGESVVTIQARRAARARWEKQHGS